MKNLKVLQSKKMKKTAWKKSIRACLIAFSKMMRKSIRINIRTIITRKPRKSRKKNQKRKRSLKLNLKLKKIMNNNLKKTKKLMKVKRRNIIYINIQNQNRVLSKKMMIWRNIRNILWAKKINKLQATKHLLNNWKPLLNIKKGNRASMLLQKSKKLMKRKSMKMLPRRKKKLMILKVNNKCWQKLKNCKNLEIH